MHLEIVFLHLVVIDFTPIRYKCDWPATFLTSTDIIHNQSTAAQDVAIHIEQRDMVEVTACICVFLWKMS
jgi:hypothetical protein